MHTLIIGGGVIGLMTALELSQAGVQITVLESQQFGQQASWAGGGILSPLYPWRYAPAVNALARFGKVLYQHWQPVLEQATGLDIEISSSGMLILDEADFRIGLSWAQQAKDPQQYAEILDARALHALNPQLNPTIKQGLWFPHLTSIRNPRLLKTLLAFLALQPNVNLQPCTAAKKFLVDAGVIQAVFDQNGKRWQADHYVIASGAWSGLLSQQFNWFLPVKPIQGQMVLFKTPAHWLPTMLMQQGIYLIPRRDGHILCGSNMSDRGFSTHVDAQTSTMLTQTACQLVPKLGSMPIVGSWAGLRPAAPQGIPFIGRAPGQSNLWLNCGHFRNGLVMAPASARLLKQQMLGEPLLTKETAYVPQQRLNPDAA